MEEVTEISVDETIRRVGKLTEASKKTVRFQDLDLIETRYCSEDCSEDSSTSDTAVPGPENFPEHLPGGDLRMFLMMVDHAPAILENKVKQKRIRDFGAYETESTGFVRTLRSKVFP